MYVHSFPKMVLDDNGLILLPEISLSWAKKRTACTLGKRLYSLHSKISPDWCNSAIIILKSLINLFFFVSLDHCKEMWADFKINLIFLLLYCVYIVQGQHLCSKVYRQTLGFFSHLKNSNYSSSSMSEACADL